MRNPVVAEGRSGSRGVAEGAEQWAWSESDDAVLLGLTQGNPAKRLPPEAPIDIEVAVQRKDLRDIQAL